MSALVKFVEALPERVGQHGSVSRWTAVALELKSKPGVWAEVWSPPAHIKAKAAGASMVVRALRKKGCEAVQRLCVVYARWPEAKP
jgi:hypothetical protein